MLESSFVVNVIFIGMLPKRHFITYVRTRITNNYLTALLTIYFFFLQTTM